MSAPANKVEEPWNKETKEKFKEYEYPTNFFVTRGCADHVPPSKSKSKWLDPCQEAASMSIKCLNRNGGDRAMCQDYFVFVLCSGLEKGRMWALD